VELWNRKSERRLVNEAAEKVERAHRFPISGRAAYRFSHEAAWNDGRVANISCSGLLLETRESLRIGAEIEVQVPVVNQSFGIDSQMHCRCTVVRTAFQDGQFAAGARITAYALGSAELAL